MSDSLRSLRRERESEEAQPLLAHSRGESHASARSVEQTPLPMIQLLVLCVMRLSEPMVFTSILPFIAQMLHENMPQVPKRELGYYAGLIESVFALVQVGCVFFWGRASDSFGRKPVLLIGLVGTFVSVNAFGLAKTLPQMILARSLAGVMNGNVAVIKCVLGELCDETNQARAFSFIPLSYAVGSILGPSIGGWLSHPVEGFPFLFGRSIFLAENPYWLPCFCVSLFNVAGFLTGFFFLKEVRQPDRGYRGPLERRTFDVSVLRKQTLPARRGDRQSPTLCSDGDQEHNGGETPRIEKPSLLELLKPNVVATLANACLINFVNICYISVLPLFCCKSAPASWTFRKTSCRLTKIVSTDTSIDDGGISFSKEDIGHLLAVNGCITIFIQLFVFPRLNRYMGGPHTVLRWCLITLPFVFLCFPLAHDAARRYGRGATMGAIGLLLFFKAAGSMMVVSSTICINNVIPTRDALGTINGFNQSLGSLARAVGPTASTSLFAWSISHPQILNGQLVWLALASVSIATWRVSGLMHGANEIQWRKGVPVEG